MESSLTEAFRARISQVGSPVMMTLYLFIRFEKKLDELFVKLGKLTEGFNVVIKDEQRQY